MNQLVPIVSSLGDEAQGFTVGEFLRIVESGAFDDIRVELVRGTIIKMAPSGNDHAHLSAQLAYLLVGATKGLPVRVGTDLAVETDGGTLRGIDIAVYDADAPSGVVDAKSVRLAVEIADTTLAKDLVLKAEEYAGAGIEIYWVVDVKAGVTHVLDALQKGAYQKRSVVRFGEPLTLPGTDDPIVVG